MSIEASADNMLTYIAAPDLPSVKPSAIALGLVFTQAVETAVLAPVLGETYKKAKQSNTSREFWESREATSTGIVCSLSPAGPQRKGAVS